MKAHATLEFQQALHADEKHKQISDAKIRAVASGMDYEQFRGMVSGAHLKPVSAVTCPFCLNARSRTGHLR